MVWISTSKKRHHQTPNTPPPTLKYCLRDLKLFLHHTQEQSLEKKHIKKLLRLAKMTEVVPFFMKYLFLLTNFIRYCCSDFRRKR